MRKGWQWGCKEDRGFFGVYFFLIFSSLLVSLNNSGQNLASSSDAGWMLGFFLHLWSYWMSSQEPREVWRNSSSSSTLFFFWSCRCLEPAALITANNLGLIFSLSKNVMVYQQLEQSKYCKKFYAGPSCKKIHDFFLFIFSFCPFLFFHFATIRISCFYSQNCAKGMAGTPLLPDIRRWFDWGEIRSEQGCHWNSGTNYAAPWDA